MIKNITKQRLIKEFALMKSFEESARDFYLKASSDPRIKDPEISRTFVGISRDEDRHAAIVQRIIDIINNL